MAVVVKVKMRARPDNSEGGKKNNLIVPDHIGALQCS